jgi:Ran GTPase-activating protein (RanGAP) involved in mRNA processing and transport
MNTYSVINYLFEDNLANYYHVDGDNNYYIQERIKAATNYNDLSYYVDNADIMLEVLDLLLSFDTFSNESYDNIFHYIQNLCLKELQEYQASEYYRSTEELANEY